MSSSFALIETVLNLLPLHKGWKVLDAACGMGKWGFLIKAHFSDIYVVGVDKSIDNLFIAKKSDSYDDLVLADVRRLPFRDMVVDCSLACEVIEHLSKDDGYEMIAELERVTRTKVLLTTPCADWWYCGKAVKEGGHITRWRPKEFKKIGFKVRGVGSKFGYKGRVASLVKHFILHPLSYVIPELGEFIVTVKEKRS
jgi:ubiquinone/menaquinone biosynthesis C-methylase UbiE